MTSGIYAITCSGNGKRYIGSSRVLPKRKAAHFKKLRHDYHGCKHMQNAWNQYGEQTFRFEVLELVADDPTELLRREQHWIDHFKASDSRFGFNTRKIAQSNRGITYPLGSPARRPKPIKTRALLSAALKGRTLSEEHRAAIAAACGRQENRALLSRRAQGVRQSAQTIAMRVSKTRGMRRSAESRQRYRDAWTPERRVLQSERMRNRSSLSNSNK